MEFPTADDTASQLIQRFLELSRNRDAAGSLTTESRVRGMLETTVARCIEHITSRVVGNKDADGEAAIRDKLRSCFDLIHAQWTAGSLDQRIYDYVLVRAAQIRDLLSLADALAQRNSRTISTAEQ